MGNLWEHSEKCEEELSADFTDEYRMMQKSC
jgi:hypothetical protein